jgi:AcrR family transcriptional regulator
MPVPKSRPRRRAEHLGPERRRPQVLDAAREIAADSGLGAVTIGSIAERLRVTRPVVYSCYPDRIALINALLDRESEQMMTFVLEALHKAHGEDPEAAFVIGFRSLLTAVNERTDTWRLIFSANSDPEVAQRVATARAALTHEAQDWIRPALDRWWQMEDVDAKLPLLMELFVSTAEAAVRAMLAERPKGAGADWQGDSERIGEFYGKSVYRAFRGA